MSEQTTQGQETGQECAWCVTGYPTATQARGIVHLLPGGIEVRCYRGAPVFAASPTPRSGGVPTREEVEQACEVLTEIARQYSVDATHSTMAPDRETFRAMAQLVGGYPAMLRALLAAAQSPTPQPQPSGAGTKGDGKLPYHVMAMHGPGAAAEFGCAPWFIYLVLADGAVSLPIGRGATEQKAWASIPVLGATPPAQPSGAVGTKIPTLEEVEKALATVSHFAHFSEAAKRDADAPADWVAQQEQRERAAHKKARTLLQQLHAAAVQGAEDRARWEKLEALMWDAEACGNGLAFMPVARHSLGVTYEPSRIMTVVDLGDEDGSNLSADVAEGDTLIAAVDALLAARQPRPEGQTTTTED